MFELGMWAFILVGPLVVLAVIAAFVATGVVIKRAIRARMTKRIMEGDE